MGSTRSASCSSLAIAPLCVIACFVTGCRKGPTNVAPAGIGGATTPTTLSTSAGPTDNVSTPSTRPITFQTKDGRLRIEYLHEWKEQRSEDFVLMLVPRQVSATTAPSRTIPTTSITLDVPDLPPHLPGMITLNRVRNGFVDDLKKQAGTSLKTKDEPVSPPMPGTQAKRVISTWKHGEESYEEDALLMIHSDRVYILKFDATSDAAPKVREAFEQIVGSIKWK